MRIAGRSDCRASGFSDVTVTPGAPFSSSRDSMVWICKEWLPEKRCRDSAAVMQIGDSRSVDIPFMCM